MHGHTHCLPSQSPFFDGKQPNWYHYNCFFKICQLRSTVEVSGFSRLRPTDQDRLRNKFRGNFTAVMLVSHSDHTHSSWEGIDTTDGSAQGGVKGKGRVTTRADLQIEYAKSGRSSCRGCNSTIEEGEIRVAKMEQPDPTEHAYAGLIPRWHHVTCFLEQAAELDAEGVDAEELGGFSKLKKEDQKELKGRFRGAGKKKAGK